MGAYYRSPIGKKLLATMPEVLQKSMAAMNRVMMREFPNLLDSLEKKRREDQRARLPEAH